MKVKKKENVMFLVINDCFGGFGLSFEAVMLYAELSGFKLYACVDTGILSGKYTYYDGKDKPFIIYYTKEPLTNEGKIVKNSYFSESEIKRDDPILVEVVRKLGEKANGTCASLSIVNIPDGVNYTIEDYDGAESIHEVHRSW